MQVDLVSIQQNINIDSGAMENFIVVKLPNEKLLHLPLNEDDLNEIVQLRRGGAPPADMTSRTFTGSRSDTTPDITTSVASYGNEEASDLTGGESDDVAVFGGAPVAQPAPPPPVEQPKQQRRGRQVSMNEYGYPRVSAEPGTVDPGEIVGGGSNVDEDGVPSV